MTNILYYLMNSITAVKEVKTSGSSKAIYLTTELNLLGDVNTGDKVKITIEKVN